MTEEDDHALAGRLATEAGELLVALRADAFAAGAHPWQVMDEGDMVCSALRELDNGDGVGRAVDGDDGALPNDGRRGVNARDAEDAQLAAHPALHGPPLRAR